MDVALWQGQYLVSLTLCSSFIFSGNMWVRLCPPQLSLYPSAVGPPRSLRPSPELHPGGQIHFPLSELPGRQRHYSVVRPAAKSKNKDSSLKKKSKQSPCLFVLVSFAVPYCSNDWSDVCGHYTLPGPPQGYASAWVEVSIWFLHERHSWAGWTHCY